MIEVEVCTDFGRAAGEEKKITKNFLGKGKKKLLKAFFQHVSCCSTVLMQDNGATGTDGIKLSF